MSTDGSAANPYDLVPYDSNPFSQSHPDRLATIAALFGMQPADISNCRVLELGCAAGGNLIPFAQQFPNSHSIGIDASGRQIDDGQEFLKSVDLDNIELRHQDILEFSDDEGFDFIISHGVFSWVPDAVQDKMLEICGKCLKPQGVAYISYNTYPGWHLRSMIRDIMRFRAKSFDTPEQQLSQARTLLSFLTNSVRGENNPYGILLRQQLESIGRSQDSYLHHEHLESINEPIYFHQFSERASNAGLQYLAESDFGSMALNNLTDEVRVMLQSVSRDRIELEQYMDFLRNRGFRQTLLCKAEVQLDQYASAERLVRLRVASSATPESGHLDLHDKEQTIFRRNSSSLSTNNPMVRAAFQELATVYPSSISFPELASIAKSNVSGKPAAVDTDTLGPESRSLAETLLRCLETGMIDLHTSEPTFVQTVSDSPKCSLLTRQQAKGSSRVTNHKHQSVSLDDFERQTVIQMTGEQRMEEIQSHLVEKIVNGDLVVYAKNARITTAEDAQEMVEQNLPNVLNSLANRAIVVE